MRLTLWPCAAKPAWREPGYSAFTQRAHGTLSLDYWRCAGTGRTDCPATDLRGNPCGSNRADWDLGRNFSRTHLYLTEEYADAGRGGNRCRQRGRYRGSLVCGTFGPTRETSLA